MQPTFAKRWLLGWGFIIRIAILNLFTFGPALVLRIVADAYRVQLPEIAGLASVAALGYGLLVSPLAMYWAAEKAKLRFDDSSPQRPA